MSKQFGKRYYDDPALGGREPAREYITALDASVKARVFVQIDRLKMGNPGRGHGVGSVQELVIDLGPGYRVYYSIVESGEMILLLVAGDKSTQQEDIKKANGYLKEFNSRGKEKEKAKTKVVRKAK